MRRISYFCPEGQTLGSAFTLIPKIYPACHLESDVSCGRLGATSGLIDSSSN